MNQQRAKDNLGKYSIDKNILDISKKIWLENDHSIYAEVKQRNVDNLGNAAIWYGGSTITYKTLLEEADLYADALVACGYHKGDEIPVCFSNIPHFIYMYLAISKIGAVINSIGNWFDSDYVDFILEKSNSRAFFCSEDNANVYSDLLSAKNISVISFSTDLSRMTESETRFIENGKQCLEKSIDEKVELSDPFTITYTSGTTTPGRPKAVLHAISSYMFLARYKDSDISGMPSMKETRILSHIPDYVHASLTTSVVDPLFQRCVIVLSKDYDADSFSNVVRDGKPNQACASVGFWLRLADLLENDPNWSGVDLSFLYVPTVSGEKLSIGEERYLNTILKKYKVGAAKFPFNIIPVSMCVGGGTTESSGVLVTLFKALQEKRFRNLKYDDLGLNILNCSSVCVLDEDGNILPYGESGTAWFVGPCNMIKYAYDENLMDEVQIVDSKNRRWVKMDASAKLNGKYNLIISGRKNDGITIDGELVSFYDVQKVLYKSIRALLSCTIIETSTGVIFHVMKRPDYREVSDNELKVQFEKCLNKMHLDRSSKDFYMTIHDKPFLLAPSGKRDTSVLKKQDKNDSLKLSLIK